MSTQKAKFELYSRLQALGFTYEEAVALRRIEMTLHRWAEAECNGEIEREEEGKYAGKPVRNSCGWVNGTSEKRVCWPIADREAGALKRLASIMADKPSLWFYHQTDPRGCALYIGSYADLPIAKPERVLAHSGESAAATPESRLRWNISTNYTRGLAVCA